jgi:hypothetical protein
MKKNVEVYIKKNTLVYQGIVGDNNSSPFLSFRDTGTPFTVDQYIGYFVYITSGVSKNARSYIVDNTTTTLFLQNAISVNINDTYQIYKSEYERLDLFKDEKINVTAQLQNANDLAKLYTDYSQSFNVPASKKNNAIFSHWYESSVDEGYDHRIRYEGYIEINTHKFKQGTFQLENAKKKNGFIDSYQLTFYGNLTQLKDVIRDDKLNSLNYTSLNHLYVSDAVIPRISQLNDAFGNPYIVRYPLIGNLKKYEYQSGVAANDITLSTGAIKWNDLFPAIPVTKVFEFIQNKYGISFTGSFLSLHQFTKLHLYCKNALEMSDQTPRQILNFTTYVGTSWTELNLNTDILTTNWDYASASSFNVKFNIKIRITPTVTNIPYSIYVYKNNELYKTFSNLTGTKTITADSVNRNDNPENINYTFEISSTSQLTFVPRVTYTKQAQTAVFSGGIWTYPLVGSTRVADGVSQSTVANINILNYIPDIKISDFINGIVKMFNLMIIPKPNNTFELLPLELYYNQGKILDITKYVYSEELTVEKPKLFKSINFTYEESNNVLNVAYKGLYGQSYGDLIYKNENTTENNTYDIKVPFENVLFEVPKEGKNFQTATLIDKDLNPYIPKPMLIYLSDLAFTIPVGDQIFLTNSIGGTQAIQQYCRFSNEINVLQNNFSDSNIYTLNFGNEQSSWTNDLAPNGLYATNYQNYIENLYNRKTRILKVKALLPVSLTGSDVINTFGQKVGIVLNDRLIIRNKRYIINSFTTDLTSGEASFELITDYRGVNSSSTAGYRFASVENIEITNLSTKVDEVIYLNDFDSFNVVSSGGFVSSPTSTNNTSDLPLVLTIPNNTSALDRFDSVIVQYYNKGVLARTDYLTVLQKA